MAEIYNFNNKQSEEHESCCEYCGIAREYMNFLVECTDPQQFFDLLREALEEARREGVREYLEAQIDAQEELLAQLTYGCEDEH